MIAALVWPVTSDMLSKCDETIGDTSTESRERSEIEGVEGGFKGVQSWLILPVITMGRRSERGQSAPYGSIMAWIGWTGKKAHKPS
jgi:hypothetical protein